jgi:hypothetical protein
MVNPVEIRFEILSKLVQAAPYAVPPETLRRQLAVAGLRVSAAEVTEHLRALADACFAQSERSPLSPSTHCWRATERGRAWLRSNADGSAEECHGA